MTKWAKNMYHPVCRLYMLLHSQCAKDVILYWLDSLGDVNRNRKQMIVEYKWKDYSYSTFIYTNRLVLFIDINNYKNFIFCHIQKHTLIEILPLPLFLMGKIQ